MKQDDFDLRGSEGDDFLQSLNRTMRALPADWDVLWLSHSPRMQATPSLLLGEVGDGVWMCTNNYVTLGIVYTRRLALQVRLPALQPGLPAGAQRCGAQQPGCAAAGCTAVATDPEMSPPPDGCDRLPSPRFTTPPAPTPATHCRS